MPTGQDSFACFGFIGFIIQIYCVWYVINDINKKRKGMPTWDKVFWIIGVILIPPLIAIIYYFMVGIKRPSLLQDKVPKKKMGKRQWGITLLIIGVILTIISYFPHISNVLNPI